MALTVLDVMEMCMDYPMETHHRVLVKLQMRDRETGVAWTQEQHDNFNVDCELVYEDPEED